MTVFTTARQYILPWIQNVFVFSLKSIWVLSVAFSPGTSPRVRAHTHTHTHTHTCQEHSQGSSRSEDETLLTNRGLNRSRLFVLIAPEQCSSTAFFHKVRLCNENDFWSTPSTYNSEHTRFHTTATHVFKQKLPTGDKLAILQNIY
jgi:hypothetical protein